MSFSSAAVGDEIDSCFPCQEAMTLLLNRRSTTADMMVEPGPDKVMLKQILEAAARVPDHRRVVPFRFVVFEGDARSHAGDVLADEFKKKNNDATPDRLAIERNRFERAPIVVGVVACLKPEHKTPIWEQTLSVGAVCQNLLIASNASGFASQWLTEWYAFDGDVLARLGLISSEKIAGFIYIGTASLRPKERKRVVLNDLVTRYSGT